MNWWLPPSDGLYHCGLWSSNAKKTISFVNGHFCSWSVWFCLQPAMCQQEWERRRVKSSFSLWMSWIIKPRHLDRGHTCLATYRWNFEFCLIQGCLPTMPTTQWWSKLAFEILWILNYNLLEGSVYSGPCDFGSWQRSICEYQEILRRLCLNDFLSSLNKVEALLDQYCFGIWNFLAF